MIRFNQIRYEIQISTEQTNIVPIQNQLCQIATKHNTANFIVTTLLSFRKR